MTTTNVFLVVNGIVLILAIIGFMSQTLSRVTTKAMMMCAADDIKIHNEVYPGQDESKFVSGSIVYFTTTTRIPKNKEIYVNKKMLFSLITEMNNINLIIENSTSDISTELRLYGMQRFLISFKKKLGLLERFVFYIYCEINNIGYKEIVNHIPAKYSLTRG